MKSPRAPSSGRWLAGLLLLGAAAAQAQIYTGVDPEGTVTLSNFRTAAAPTLLVPVPAPEPQARRRPQDAQAALGFQEHVVAASAQTGLPAALINAVIRVESNFNPGAVSRKGATGLMQLMPDTGRRFGARDLVQPEENVMAGSRYLRYLLDLFDQNLELALAAYNCGENAVLRAGRRVPGIAETQAYVPKVLANYRVLQSER